MKTDSSARHRFVEFAVMTVALVVLMGIAFALEPSVGGQQSSADASPSPFTGAAPARVSQESCGSVPGREVTCTSSTYDAGIPRSFNLTSQPENQAPATVYTEYFGVTVSKGDVIGYSMTATNATTFAGYFDPGSDGSSAASGQVVQTLRPFVNMTGNYQSYSGNVTASQPGAFVFLLSVPGPEYNDSASFLLMDSAAYASGITVKAWAPEFQRVVVSNYGQDGLAGQTGFGWQEVPITVYSPRPTAVNLTSLSLDEGFLKISPSYLPDVGPGGANATIYLVGVQETDNPLNEYVYIGASGADGLTGDTTLWVESGSGGSIVTGSGPVNLSGGGIQGLVYDPPPGAPSTIPVSFSIAGLLQNGSVVPLPGWLKVSFPDQRIVFGNGTTVATTETLGPGSYFSYIPMYENDTVRDALPSSSSFGTSLLAYNPAYLVLNVDTSAATPQEYGVYTVVLNETLGGQHYTGYATVHVEQLVLPGGLPPA